MIHSPTGHINKIVLVCIQPDYKLMAVLPATPEFICLVLTVLYSGHPHDDLMVDGRVVGP